MLMVNVLEMALNLNCFRPLYNSNSTSP